MTLSRVFRGLLLLIVIMLAAGLMTTTSLALIAVKLPLSKFYAESKEIIVAKVDTVDAEKNVANVHEAVGFSELNKYLRKKDRSLILQLDTAKTLAGQLKKGDPVVLFTSDMTGVVHVRDQWYSAKPATGNDWTVGEKQNLATTFPGTTPSLIRALMLLRAEKAPILDNIEHSTWTDGFKLQRLDVTGKIMAIADASGDRKPTLILVTEKGLRCYQSPGGPNPFVDVTEKSGLAGVTGRQVAFCDINADGKADLLLEELFLSDGGKFVRSKSDIDLKGKEVLAVALMDATGDGRPDAITLSPDGTLTVYENPGKDAAWPQKSQSNVWKGGEARWAAHIAAWGDDGKPHVMAIEKTGPVRYSMTGESADFKRLTGETEPIYKGKPRHFPIDDYMASSAWDRLGGDGYPDLFITTKRGGLADLEIIGRGHGAFFYNKEGNIKLAIKGERRPFQPKSVAMASGDIDGNGTLEMFFLEASGDLWVSHSPFFVGGSPIDKPKK